jgi:hypothetical protein
MTEGFLGDVMHGTPPPTGEQGPYRVSLLLAFAAKGAYHQRGEHHYNDILLGRDDGQVAWLRNMAAGQGRARPAGSSYSLYRRSSRFLGRCGCSPCPGGTSRA